MTYLTYYDKRLDEYKRWIIRFERHLEIVEENILQNDNADKILEKVVSVAISSAFVTVGLSIVTLFGLASGGVVGGLVIFIIGWVGSNGINRKVFGKEKNIDEVNMYEKLLLNEKQKLLTVFKQIKTKLLIQKYKKDVAYTQYLELRKKLAEFYAALSEHNVNNLAYKYRYRHSKVIQKNSLFINQFTQVYSNKKHRLKESY